LNQFKINNNNSNAEFHQNPSLQEINKIENNKGSNYDFKGDSNNVQLDQMNSPIKNNFDSEETNSLYGKKNAFLTSNEIEINNIVKNELDGLFKFIEDELNQESLILIMESTQFSSNSEKESTKDIPDKSNIVNYNNDIENAFTDFTYNNNSNSDKDDKDQNVISHNFISVAPKPNKNSKNKQKKKFDLINNFDSTVLNVKDNTDNHNNNYECKNEKEEKISKQTSQIFTTKTEKKFSSSLKEKENIEKNLNLKDNKKKNIKQNFKNIFSKIETKLRLYLREAQNQKIFESNAFKSFLNEDKLKTPSSFNTIKSQTPSVIKNFFEDTEVMKEMSKKRHTIAGEEMKNHLERFKELDFKHKCYSNYREENQLKELKNFSRKESNISNFSINLSENSCSDNKSQSDNSSENHESVFEFDSKKSEENTFVGKINGIRLSKRGSILRERLNIMKFDIVEEERNIENVNSEDEKKE